MKQAEDKRTADLFAGDKRGRGRPRQPGALTDAQRAKRYRDKVKAQANKRDASR